MNAISVDYGGPFSYSESASQSRIPNGISAAFRNPDADAKSNHEQR
jgi:hypothetical protein